MAVTRAWNETKPAGGDLAATLDTQGQEHKQDTRERMLQGGHVWNQATLTDEGKHAVDAGGVGVSPDVYKSNKTDKLIAWTDTLVTLGSAVRWTGSQNIDRLAARDDMVGIDAFTTAKGYKHAVEALRIFESDPADSLVNVKSGMFVKAGGREVGRFAGGTINISGAQAGLAANQQRLSVLALTGAGALAWRNGTAVADPGPPTDIADLEVDDNPIGLFRVFDDSVEFVRDGSDPDVFLKEDWRADSYAVPAPGISQILGEGVISDGGGLFSAPVTLVTQAVTISATSVVLILYQAYSSSNQTRLVRDGTMLEERQTNGNPTLNVVMMSHVLDLRPAGSYSYSVQATNSASGQARLTLIVIPLQTIG